VNYALEDFPSQSRRFELIDWVLEFLNWLAQSSEVESQHQSIKFPLGPTPGHVVVWVKCAQSLCS
jgi:hypothetical protein